MKKCILFLFLTTSLSMFGQKGQSYGEVTFYGIDFSLCKIYGAGESNEQFRYAFENINELLLSEPKKYDVGKLLHIQVKDVNISYVIKLIDKMDIQNLKIFNDEYKLSEQNMQNEIHALPVANEPGTGLVIIAELLNKNSKQGIYHLVFFDNQSKEIFEIRTGRGKAGGIGLRNFWANSVYNMLKNAR